MSTAITARDRRAAKARAKEISEFHRDILFDQDMLAPAIGSRRRSIQAIERVVNSSSMPEKRVI